MSRRDMSTERVSSEFIVSDQNKSKKKKKPHYDKDFAIEIILYNISLLGWLFVC